MLDKNSVSIAVASEPYTLCLRSATDHDLDHLREWKNAQRMFFFHQDLITPAQQQTWFDSFVQRTNDFMLLVEHDGAPIGCMGIRLMGDEWDIYNVILGNPAYSKQGHMHRAFTAMLQMAQAKRALPITLKVLKHNPAVGWYLKNGFTTTFEATDHFGLTYQPQTAKDTSP
jgi:RimJ/RimL family protein N-acetyltransferase